MHAHRVRTCLHTLQIVILLVKYMSRSLRTCLGRLTVRNETLRMMPACLFLVILPDVFAYLCIPCHLLQVCHERFVMSFVFVVTDVVTVSHYVSIRSSGDDSKSDFVSRIKSG